MTTAAVATATSPLWFTTRATGLIALVLLTITVVLGILTSVRFASPAWPRFVTVYLHRNLSLLTISFVAVHVLTTITDPFAGISVVSVVIPFTSAYRTIWLGLGAVAFDILVALLVTSLLRSRVPPRVWRAVHWAGYACWPIALVHGLGTGTDGGARWVLGVTVTCALAVTAAGLWRLIAGWPANAGTRLAAGCGAVLVGLVTAGWAWAGPLSPDWARRAGTPASLLARSAGNSAASSATVKGGSASGTGSSVSSGSSSFPSVPFTAKLSGSVHFGPGAASGDRSVTLTMADGNAVRLRVVISGPAVSGGVDMTSSSVSLGPSSAASRYTGHVSVLEGSSLQAAVSGAGTRLTLQITLTSQTSTTVTATVTARQTGEGEGE